MKFLKNITSLIFAFVLFCLPLNAVFQNQVSDYDKYSVIKYGLEVENPGQDVIYSITQLGNPLHVCEVMELFFRVGTKEERSQIVNYLSTKGAFVDSKGSPVLHVAATLSDQAQACRIIEFLFQVLGSQYINKQDSAGQTPLHIAAQAGHEQIVHCLLENSANETIATHSGKLAFELAHDAGHKAIRDYLSDLYQKKVMTIDGANYSENIRKHNNSRNVKNRTVCYSNL